jgi:hypothetical protein
MSKLFDETAQWIGSRPSSSFKRASFGSAYMAVLGNVVWTASHAAYRPHTFNKDSTTVTAQSTNC